MRRPSVKSGLALVGGCAAASILLPPLAGILNAIATLALLGMAALVAYRGWAWMESIVEASRRPVTVRRNRKAETNPTRDPAGPERTAGRPGAEIGEPSEREFAPVFPRLEGPAAARGAGRER
ncbi:MAG: hypothetical protein ACREN4_00550 [Candidatus Dormibacteria bacterium]